jgi:glutamate 5-kinase
MKRVVIKIGTGVLTREDASLNGAALARLVTALADLIDSDLQVVVVSSGAVGAGVSALGLEEYPDDVQSRQAAAAVGQCRLMHAYENLFRSFEKSVAQLLLTAEDFADEVRRGRISDTLDRLLVEKRIVPIINENDSVAVEELRFGDNDMLSSRVANLIGADLLVLLTSVDGVMGPEGEVIPVVEDVSEVLGYVDGSSGNFSIGGMATKLEAVQHALDHGIETVIGNGSHPERLAEFVQGSGLGTRFRAGESSSGTV